MAGKKRHGMSPRIISGKAKGFRLRSVPGDATRPITDRTKEALFNIIGMDVAGSTFLDLFAGTGSVGIEALSRGASFVLFVDLNRAAVDTIQANLKHTGLISRAQALHMDAFTLLKSAPTKQFDYIYIAPPQYKNLWSKALLEVDAHTAWLTPDAWVIVQIDPREYQPVDLQHLEEFDQRRYGNTSLLFYRLIRQD
jgi:16S rRNA (guanine966-N2)-methyltransferase